MYTRGPCFISISLLLFIIIVFENKALKKIRSNIFYLEPSKQRTYVQHVLPFSGCKETKGQLLYLHMIKTVLKLFISWCCDHIMKMVWKNGMTAVKADLQDILLS